MQNGCMLIDLTNTEHLEILAEEAKTQADENQSKNKIMAGLYLALVGPARTIAAMKKENKDET